MDVFILVFFIFLGIIYDTVLIFPAFQRNGFNAAEMKRE